MQHINSFHKGIVRGVDYTISPQDSYLYMLNGLIISRDDKGFVVTPVKGTTSIAQFSALEAPIGTIDHAGILYIITHKKVDTEAYICFYSYKGSNGDEWVDDMRLIPNGPDRKLRIPAHLLGYDNSRLLQVFAKESYDSSVDIYICDGLNPNTVVNTGIDRYGKRTDRQYKSFESPVQFALHKSITKAPRVETSIKQQGNIKPGTYYFYVRYEDDTMNATPFIKEVGPVVIHTGSTDAGNVVGVTYEDNARVSKSITLRISDVDPLYKAVSIGVVYYFGADGILSRENFLIDKSYVLEDGICYVNFNGDNAVRTLTTEEVLADNIQYNISKTHLQLDNRMYGANWSGGEIDFSKLQELALKIYPRAVLDKEDNFNKVHDENNQELEYMEGEIYPFGVSFLIDGRYKTPVFPISGWEEGHEYYESINVPSPIVPEIVNISFYTLHGFYYTPNYTNPDNLAIKRIGLEISRTSDFASYEYRPTYFHSANVFAAYPIETGDYYLRLAIVIDDNNGGEYTFYSDSKKLTKNE